MAPEFTPTPQLQIPLKAVLDSTSFNINSMSLACGDDNGDGSVSGKGGARRACSELLLRLQRRSKRPAKIPSPVDHFFAHSELGKVLFGVMVTFMLAVLADYHQWGIMSKEDMEKLLLLPAFGFFLFIAAILLQKRLPELAVLAMLAGASVALVSLNALIRIHLSSKKSLVLLYIICILYFGLLSYIVYVIFKEDVREPEEIDLEGGISDAH